MAQLASRRIVLVGVRSLAVVATTALLAGLAAPAESASPGARG
jgi:hypothetical protein